ncbi:MAG: hypothetical protein M5U01_24050 [Ardenticatenaceae bacterium]|nr:hypothetical protein [Ardenticatenaceae bacterium]
MPDERTVPGTETPPEPFESASETPEVRDLLGDDLVQVGHVYSALVTAHFPDSPSADRAIRRLEQVGVRGPGAIQRFQKEEPDITAEQTTGRLPEPLYRLFIGQPAEDSDNDPGLAAGEVGLVVHVDESQGPQVLRICEEAGALHARFHPAQQLGAPGPS